MADLKVNIGIETTGTDKAKENIDSTAQSLTNFKEAAKEAASETGTLKDALSQAAVDAAVKQSWDDLAGSTAKLAEGLAQQAAGVEKIVNAFMNGVDSTASYGDEIDKMSQKLGVSAKAYQEWDYVLKQNGTSMKQMTSAFDQIRKVQTGYAKDAESDLGKIGLSLEEIEGMSKEDAFAAIINGLQDMAEGAERDSVAKGLLGSAYKQLGPLLNSTADDVTNLRNRFEELGAPMSDEDVKAAAAYADSVDDINLKWESFKRGIYSDFLPALTQLRENVIDSGSLNQLAETIGKLAENGVGLLTFLVDHSDAAITAVEGIGAAWATWKGAEIVGQLVTNVSQLYGWLGKLGGVLGVSGGAAAAGIGLVALSVGTLIDYSNQLDNAGYLGDGHSLQEYADNVAAYEEALAKWHATYDEYMQSGYTEGIEQLQQELGILETGLRNATAEYNAAKEVASTVIDSAQGALQGDTADATGAQETADAITDGAEKGAAVMVDTFESATGQLSADFQAGVDEMSQAAVDSITGVNDAMNENMAIVSANAQIWGTDMMISFANGLAAGWNDYTGSQLQAIAQAIQDMFGHSEPKSGPLSNDSTWMPDMMRSWAEGIRANRALVLGELDTLAGGMAASVNLGAMGAGAGASYNYGGVSVTFNVPDGMNGRELYEEFSFWLQNDMAREGAVWGH